MKKVIYLNEKPYIIAVGSLIKKNGIIKIIDINGKIVEGTNLQYFEFTKKAIKERINLANNLIEKFKTEKLMPHKIMSSDITTKDVYTFYYAEYDEYLQNFKKQNKKLCCSCLPMSYHSWLSINKIKCTNSLIRWFKKVNNKLQSFL
jgi:lipopolysaccharide export LptBFGC system permease protein LptF